MKDKTINADVLAAYNAGIEKGRLRSGIGLIEFARTMELLREFLPPAPAVLYDIGGGYGEYAWALAALGYQVHLFDLSATNIQHSASLAAEHAGIELAEATVCDARAIPRPSASADAILLFGPLYHIVEKAERLSALAECSRLLKEDGLLFCAAISPFATLLWAATAYGRNNQLLTEPAFQEMIRREVSDGQHCKPENSTYRGMGRSFFHSPHRLRQELREGGFADNDLRGILGCGWLVPNLDQVWLDPIAKAAILSSIRLVEKEENLLGLSTHLLAISHKAKAAATDIG